MNLPKKFEERSRIILGDEYNQFLDAITNQETPTSVRANNKINYHPSNNHVKWCNEGYYLNERPLFTADPFLHAGVYYVQEASSMFLKKAVEQHFPKAQTVLDLCAAPGGKSTLLSQTLEENVLLVSNEIVRSRANILVENMTKWGNTSSVVTNNKPEDFAKLAGFFDAIVIDAPCSGEGMFRKDSTAISEWSLSNVEMCASRQKQIISDSWDALKTDGILVYSTCTYNTEENEENVAWIASELGAEVLKIEIANDWGITESKLGYRFYPHKTKGEGFFLSVLKKTSDTPKFKTKKKPLKNNQIAPYTADIFFKLIQSENLIICSENEKLSAYPKKWFKEIILLKDQLNCLYTSIELGEMINKKIIPSAALALSKALDFSSVPIADLDYKNAISFLRSESIILNDYPKGYILVRYNGVALGWVNNVGNRCNNLFPQAWRIRMEIKV